MAADDLLNRKAAAAYLTKLGCPVSPKTLAVKATNGNAGRGPPFFRYTWHAVRYARKDLDDWASKNMMRVD